MKIFTRISLVLAFLLLAAVIIAPLYAELYIHTARKMLNYGRFKEPRDNYYIAVKIDPFSSDYQARLGNFLFKNLGQARYKKATLYWAQVFLKRAIELNPKNAQYWVDLGRMNSSPRTMMLNFKQALQNDPYGFSVSYRIGYVGMKRWESLTPEDRKIILERLEYCLKIRPWYKKRIDPKILEQMGKNGK